MPITRAVMESKLVRSSRGLLEAIAASEDGAQGVDQSTLAADALGSAMNRLGYAMLDQASGPSDAELAVVPDANLPVLLALATVLLHELILGNVLAVVTEQDGTTTVDWSDMARGLERMIAREWADLDKRFGPALKPRGAARSVSGLLATPPIIPDAVAEPYQ